MKTKQEKRNEAKKVAEAKSQQRKAVRNAKAASAVPTGKPGQKGKSLVPQSKAKKK